MTKDYPIQESVALLITKEVAPYIILQYDKESDNVPESVQALLDTDCFDVAVQGKLTLSEFTAKYPQYKNLKELIPDDYYDTSFVPDILDETNIDHVSTPVFTGEAETYDNTTSPRLIRKTYDDELLVYMPPYRMMSYFSTTYDSIDELIEEFKTRLGDYLPDTFDIRPYLCTIEGTYFS